MCSSNWSKQATAALSFWKSWRVFSSSELFAMIMENFLICDLPDRDYTHRKYMGSCHNAGVPVSPSIQLSNYAIYLWAELVHMRAKCRLFHNLRLWFDPVDPSRGYRQALRENEQHRDLTSFLLRILTIKQNVCDMYISTRSVVQLVFVCVM